MITPTSGSIELPGKTYNAYWVKTLHVDSPTLSNQATVTAKLVPFNSDTGDIAENLDVNLYIPNALALSTTDSEFAQTMGTIFAELQRQARLQGLI